MGGLCFILFFLGTLSACLFFPFVHFPLCLTISWAQHHHHPTLLSSLSAALHWALASCTLSGSPPLDGEELVWVAVMLAQWWMDRKTKNPSPAFLLLQWGERVERKGRAIPECLCIHCVFDSNCRDLHPSLWSTPRQECLVIIWVFLTKVTEKKQLPEKVKQRKKTGHVEMFGGLQTFVSQT